MKKRIIFLLAAILALPSLCLASDAIKNDSVKVIKNPKQVTIIKGKDRMRLNVDGNDTDKDYTYEYYVKARDDGKLFAYESEGGRVRYCHPFTRNDSSWRKPHWEVFTSVGWAQR